MKTSAEKLRRRALGRLPTFGALVLGFGVIASCGDDDTAPGHGSSGTGNKAGAAGSSAGSGGSGTQGSGGNAGATGGVDGGVDSASGAGGSSGGTSGAGGSAGSSDGGLCGNKTRDPGEQCDDGNTASGDGCSASCVDTARCSACEQKYCKGDADYDLLMGYCLNDTTPAADGPAAGRPRNELCKNLLSCMRNTNCYPTSSSDPRCYCGTLSPTECRATGAKPNGACVAEIQAAAESRDGDAIAARLTSLTLPIGWVNLMVGGCDTSACGWECQLALPTDDCYRCSVGPNAVLQESQQTCYLRDCYVRDANLCPALVSCARQTGCSRNGMASCFGDGTGPCAAQITAAAGSMTRDEIVVALRNPSGIAGALGAGLRLSECQARSCPSACFAADAGAADGSAD